MQKKRSILHFWWVSVVWSIGAGVFIFVGITFLFPEATVIQKLIRASVLSIVGLGISSILAVIFLFAERQEKGQSMKKLSEPHNERQDHS